MKNEKKQIAIFTRGLSMNGATKSLVELLKKIDFSIIDLDLYVLSFENSSKELMEEIPKHVNILSVPRYNKSTKSLISAFSHPIHFFKSIQAKKKLLSEKMIIQWKATAARLPKIKKQYDVAISYRHLDIDVFFVKNNMCAKKKIFWIHGAQQLKKDEIQILSSVYNSYDCIFPVSNAAKKNILKFFPLLENKCKVAYCIIDSNEIKKLSLEGNSFVKDKDELTILTIGRLNKEKGIDLAINTCEILKNRGFKFKWYVCGEGDQRKHLEKMIIDKKLSNNFVLLGNQKNPYGYLKDCDIYVQPSYLESYCLTINEAKILNKPIVSTNLDAAKEQLIDMKTGILSETNSINLANSIQLLLENKKLRDNLSNELSKEDFSHDEAIKILMNEIFLNRKQG